MVSGCGTIAAKDLAIDIIESEIRSAQQQALMEAMDRIADPAAKKLLVGVRSRRDAGEAGVASCPPSPKPPEDDGTDHGHDEEDHREDDERRIFHQRSHNVSIVPRR